MYVPNNKIIPIEKNRPRMRGSETVFGSLIHVTDERMLRYINMR